MIFHFELEQILEQLIEHESERIRELPIWGDGRSEEYRRAGLRIMRYMGKRDAYYYLLQVIKGLYSYEELGRIASDQNEAGGRGNGL